MRNLLAMGLLLAMTFLLQGCISFGGSSPEAEYYLLAAKAKGPDTLAGQIQSGRVSVGPVLIPDYLDRPQIVTRNGTKVRIADLHRWAEPLDISVIRVVSENLERLYPGWKTIDYLAPQASRAERSLRLKIRRFDGLSGPQASLDIDWELRGPASTNTPATGRFQLTVPVVDASYAALVDSFSTGLVELCRQLPLR